MTNKSITDRIRRLERAGNADNVKRFLAKAVLVNLDLRPWEKRINALMRQVGLNATLDSMKKMPNEDITLRELKDRLHPRRFPGMSPKMAFIVGAIIGEDWAKGPRGETSPGSHFSITSDGFVVCGSMFIGDVEDFNGNLERLEQAAKLNEEQRILFAKRKAAVVTDWR